MSQQGKTQADCFRELARVMEMCEGTRVFWGECLKHSDSTAWNGDTIPAFKNPNSWSFAVAIVEDKPVFIRDTQWFDGAPIIIAGVGTDSAGTGYLITNHGNWLYPSMLIKLSWNPPKHKEPEIPKGDLRENSARSFLITKAATVMVELSVEDAEYLSKNAPHLGVLRTVIDAINKALKEKGK